MNLKSINLNDIRLYEPSHLIKLGKEIGAEFDGSRQRDLISGILKKANDLKIEIMVSGILDVINDNYGFLRYESDNYTNTNEDVFVSNSMIKRFNLKMGDMIKGVMKQQQNQSDKQYVMGEILSVNDKKPSSCIERKSFENMTALYPSRKIQMELANEENNKCEGNLSLRMMDMFVPMGFGQRALIVAPPKAGKTTLMRSIARAISTNHPEAHLIVLLIGERPEEVTEAKRSIKGQVISSTFDEPPAQHVHVADVTIARAKRLAEMGKDVILLMDSLTRFARSNNSVVPSSGKVLTGGIDSNALQKPKQFFGAARDLEGAGSITIIATALIETGSKADELVFEEFKGTGNWELILDRKLADRRVFPAINITSSGTRNDDRLLQNKEKALLDLLRRHLSSMGIVEACELVRNRVLKTRNNNEFIAAIASS